MSTPTPSNNLGSSRLLGTNDAQRAVDSLTRQVNNLERSVANAARAFQSLANGANRANRGTTGSGTWNMNSNFPGNVGGNTRGAGGAQFTNTGTLNGQAANGGGWRGAAAVMMGAGRGNGNANNGGGGAGVSAAAGRFGMAGAVISGAARGAVNYGNRYMNTNMQMDMFGNYSTMIGGVGPGGRQATNNMAMRSTFVNNRIALDANDAARGGYMAAYTFGAPQFYGKDNAAYLRGTTQAAGFAFASPTAGATGAMNAAQQFYSNRSFYGLQAFGIQSPIGQGGKQAPMSQVAGSIMQRLYGTQTVSTRTLDAGFKQGGYAGQSLQNIGRNAGWDQKTITMVENYLKGRNTAMQAGMTAAEFDKLTQTAATGSGSAKRSALDKLEKTTGMGASMFERQRDLNATRLNRQEQILESLAPAFENATDAVNRFSGALNKFLDTTGLDSVIGGVSGTLTPFSNALGGFGGLGGGLLGGLLGGALMRGGGGLLGGLLGRFGAGAAGAAGARGLGGMMTATRGAGGVYTVTSMGGAAAGALRSGLMRGGLYGAGAYATSELGGAVVDSVSEKGSTANKWGHVGTNAATGALVGAGIGSVVPVVGTGVGALAGGAIGTGYGIYNQFFGDGGVKKGFRTINSDGINGGADAPVSGVSSSKKKGNATGTTGANAAQVIKFAQQQLGDPYVWGGNGPDGWDCSGLLKWAYKQAGVDIPRVAKDQQRVGKAVSTSKVQPGDLLFNGNPAYHVVMAIGGGKIIEAPKPGYKVRIRNFSPGEFTNARRILGSVGNMNDLALDESAEDGTLNEQGSSVGGDIGGGYGGTSELAALMSALGGGTGGGPTALNSQSGGGTSTADSAASTVSGSNPPGNPKGNAALGKKLAEKYGWTGNQWKALYNLWMRESGWNEKADNPTSDAYGIPQSLPGSKMAAAGKDWKTNPATQIKWGLQYIKERYGTPAKAWSFWNAQNPHWYADGAWNLDQDTTARVHKGEMILPAKQAESVRNAITNTLTTGTATSGRGGIVFESGSIVVNPNGKMTAQEAQMTAKNIVDAVCEDHRIKEIQKGY